MPQSYLIQRLLPAPAATEQGDFEVKAARVFGGGSLGMGEKGFDALRHVFLLDYMGAAEYEFGIIPKTLSNLATATDLVSFSFVLPSTEIKPGWWRESQAREERRKILDAARAAGKRAPRAKKVTVTLPDRTFYVLCRKGQEEYVRGLVRNCAAGTQRTKADHGVDYALDPMPGRASRRDPTGWLELDHGFFFFLDQTMWEATCGLFNVKPEG